MKYNLIIRSCAEKDIDSSIKWYNQRKKRLATSFLFNLDQAINSLIKNPKIYPKVYKNIRRILIKKFPFSIYYILEKDLIIVLAVFHEKRNPENWKKRI